MNIRFKKYWRKTSLKQKGVGEYFLQHIFQKKPKNFLEIGIFHGVTARNVCELLNTIHEGNFKFTGIDLFSNKNISKSEYPPQTNFLNPLKTLYYKYIIKLDPYSLESVLKLLKKFKNNVKIIEGNSNVVLSKINIDIIDYVFLDGGHMFETVKKDLELLTPVIKNNGIILCDDYDLSYAPGVKKAIDEYVDENQFSLKILFSRFAEISKISK